MWRRLSVRRWARLRTALAAFCSHSGGFGFTNGVEWLATRQHLVQDRPEGEQIGTLVQPFAPQTTYAFILTSGIESSLGVAAGADIVFGAVRDAHLAGLMSVPGTPELDPLFPAITPLVDAGIGLFSLPGTSIVSAWSMTTQSITNVLDTIEAAATRRPYMIVPSGLTTAAISSSLPGIADIYVGYIEVPYYGDPQAPIHTHVAPRYIRETPTEIGVPNVVTAVLASFRGYDTLGETTVIFTAGIAVLLLLRDPPRRRRRDDE